jgi:hypothetical protein
MSHESNAAMPPFSVVLNVMGRIELAEYGFRSWMLQKDSGPYEVVLNLFNDQQSRFEALAADRNKDCRLVIHAYPKPAYFNISAANNIGLHHASGRYVFFANADVIYHTGCARTLVDECCNRNLGYAMGARVDLTESQAAALKPAKEYDHNSGFDFLVGYENLEGMNRWTVGQGWMLRKDIALAVGGFDSRVRCGEDLDITHRAIHYLRRTGQQRCHHFLSDFWSYHVYHPTSELFDTFDSSKEVWGPRTVRLNADPGSTEDVVDSPLHDHEQLVQTFLNTPKPPAMGRYRKNPIKKLRGRIGRAFNVLVGRR